MKESKEATNLNPIKTHSLYSRL